MENNKEYNDALLALKEEYEIFSDIKEGCEVSFTDFEFFELSDLGAVEARLMEGPYIHHFVEMAGDYTKEIEEFCKYFPNLNVDKI